MDLNKVEEDYQKKINRNKVIVNGLENYEPFKMLLEDFNQNLQIADSNWHLINLDEYKDADGNKKSGKELFYNLKYNKLSALAVVNIIETYKQEIQKATKTLSELKDPDKQNSYYDEK